MAKAVAPILLLHKVHVDVDGHQLYEPRGSLVTLAYCEQQNTGEKHLDKNLLEFIYITYHWGYCGICENLFWFDETLYHEAFQKSILWLIVFTKR